MAIRIPQKEQKLLEALSLAKNQMVQGREGAGVYVRISVSTKLQGLRSATFCSVHIRAEIHVRENPSGPARSPILSMRLAATCGILAFRSTADTPGRL